MDNLSSRVKKEREARGITIEELAKGTFISVAVLKDIENGQFDRYEGDELYIKMYLRKIAKYLGLEEKELDADFEALTQEIQLKKTQELKMQNEAIKDKTPTVSTKINDVIKDIKPTRPSPTVMSKKHVYEDHYLKRYLKYAVIGIVVVATIFVIWYAIIATRSDDSSSSTNETTPTVEGTTESGTQSSTTPETTEPETTEPETTEPETTPEATAVQVTKNGPLDYNITLPAGETTFTFKMEFVTRTWANLDVNGREYSEFTGRIYNNDNRTYSTSAEPETVELTFDATTFENLELHTGYSRGHRFYINDVQLPIESSEYSNNNATLKVTLNK